MLHWFCVHDRWYITVVICSSSNDDILFVYTFTHSPIMFSVIFMMSWSYSLGVDWKMSSVIKCWYFCILDFMVFPCVETKYSIQVKLLLWNIYSWAWHFMTLCEIAYGKETMINIQIKIVYLQLCITRKHF